MEPDTINPLTWHHEGMSIDFALAYNRAEFQQTIDALASGAIDATRYHRRDRSGRGPAMFTALKRPGSRAKVMVEFPH